MSLSHEEHRQRHVQLHQAFDELVADWLAQTRCLPSESSVMELMMWSASQTQNPTESRFESQAPAHRPVIEVKRG